MTKERGALIEAMARALCEAQGVRRIDGNEMARARDEVEAALTAISSAGYVVAPVEPTDAMIIAGIIERHEQPTPEAWSLATSNIYRTMLSASPITTKGTNE